MKLLLLRRSQKSRSLRFRMDTCVNCVVVLWVRGLVLGSVLQKELEQIQLRLLYFIKNIITQTCTVLVWALRSVFHESLLKCLRLQLVVGFFVIRVLERWYPLWIYWGGLHTEMQPASKTTASQICKKLLNTITLHAVCIYACSPSWPQNKHRTFFLMKGSSMVMMRFKNSLGFFFLLLSL